MTVTTLQPGDETAPRNIKPAIHGKIYRWVLQYAAGKTALDIGCGDGLGSAILAEKAHSVTGIDVDLEIVASAAHHRDPQPLRLLQMACEELALADESFDLIVANALVEYLQDVDALFREAHRVLASGGLFVCGTKNLLRSLQTPDGRPLYGNHEQEFAPESLRTKLEKHFTSVELYGEFMSHEAESLVMNPSALRLERLLVTLNVKHAFPVKWRKSIRRWITGVATEAITEDDFEISSGRLDDAFYLIGVGTKA